MSVVTKTKKTQIHLETSIRVIKVQSQNLPPSKSQISSTSFHYYRIFFNFVYYAGFCPFRFKYNPASSTYVFHINKFQRGLCIFLHGITAIVAISIANEYGGMMIQGSEARANDPNFLFERTTIVCMTAYPFILIGQFWRKEHVVRKYLRYCQEIIEGGGVGLKYDANSWRKSKGAIFIAIVLCSISTLFGIFTHSRNILTLSTSNESYQKILNGMVQRFRFNFFLERRGNLTLDTMEMSNKPSIPLAIISVLYSMLSTYDHFVVSIFGTIFILASLSIRHISVELQDELMLFHSVDSDNQIMRRFSFVNNLVDLVNEFAGPAVLISFISVIPLFSIQVVEAIHSTDFETRMYTILLLTSSLVPIIIAADASNRFDKFRKWLLSRNFEKSKSSGLRIVMVFTKLSTEPMGIDGCGLFVITYRFVGTAMSLLMTYSILAFQLRGS